MASPHDLSESSLYCSTCGNFLVQLASSMAPCGQSTSLLKKQPLRGSEEEKQLLELPQCISCGEVKPYLSGDTCQRCLKTLSGSIDSAFEFFRSEAGNACAESSVKAIASTSRVPNRAAPIPQWTTANVPPLSSQIGLAASQAPPPASGSRRGANFTTSGRKASGASLPARTGITFAKMTALGSPAEIRDFPSLASVSGRYSHFFDDLTPFPDALRAMYHIQGGYNHKLSSPNSVVTYRISWPEHIRILWDSRDEVLPSLLADNAHAIHRRSGEERPLTLAEIFRVLEDSSLKGVVITPANLAKKQLVFRLQLDIAAVLRTHAEQIQNADSFTRLSSLGSLYIDQEDSDDPQDDVAAHSETGTISLKLKRPRTPTASGSAVATSTSPGLPTSPPRNRVKTDSTVVRTGVLNSDLKIALREDPKKSADYFKIFIRRTRVAINCEFRWASASQGKGPDGEFEEAWICRKVLNKQGMTKFVYSMHLANRSWVAKKIKPQILKAHKIDSIHDEAFICQGQVYTAALTRTAIADFEELSELLKVKTFKLKVPTTFVGDQFLPSEAGNSDEKMHGVQPYIVESFMPSRMTFRRFSKVLEAGKNTGLLGETVDAFAHFATLSTLGKVALSDIQGFVTSDSDDEKACFLFDIILHMHEDVDPRFPLIGNQKVAGIQAFLASHSCNSICDALGLSKLSVDDDTTTRHPCTVSQLITVTEPRFLDSSSPDAPNPFDRML